MKSMHRGFPAILVGVALLFLLGVGTCPATAQEQEEKNITTTIERKIRGPQPVAEPGLKDKGGRTMIIITAAGRFNITSATEVVDKDGKMSSMDDLRVPCEALIVYQPLRRNDPNALRVEVKKVLPGAKSSWAAPQPQ